MHVRSYLQSARLLLGQYDGAVPFAGWLKAWFRQHKKFGSKDRKHIAHLCYCYFRLGRLLETAPLEERLAAGVFLCSGAPNELLAALRPEWNAAAFLPPEEKLDLVDRTASVNHIFPWNDELSTAIDRPAFNRAFLLQPHLYLRIRPGQEARVKAALTGGGIGYTEVHPLCLAVDNSSKADAVIQLDREAVVQDLSSQQVLGLLNDGTLPPKPKVWDCCAASGGKSILLKDLVPQADLLVSDVRPSILHNLRNRFAAAGIKNYRWLVGDAARMQPAGDEKFDLVICDAPCSGSGTWSRTPEQLLFFSREKIGYYAGLQRSIIGNAAKSLKPAGLLLYITCSVFEKENEAVVAYVRNELQLPLLATRYLKGYELKADTLFTALFAAS